MGQKIAEFEDGIVEIVAEHRFAEMLDEDPPDRAAAVEHAAIMARAGPQLIALLGVIDERAEEGGLQRFGILLQPADGILGDEFGRLLGEKHVAVDIVQHLDGNILEPLAADQYDDRHFEAAAAHEIDQRGGFALDALLAPVHHHAADGGVGLDGDLGILHAPRADDRDAKLFDRGDDLLEPQPFEILFVECRRADEEGETP